MKCVECTSSTRTGSTCRPVSSCTSRRSASRGSSPWSMPPPGSVHRPSMRVRDDIRVSSTSSAPSGPRDEHGVRRDPLTLRGRARRAARTWRESRGECAWTTVSAQRGRGHVVVARPRPSRADEHASSRPPHLARAAHRGPRAVARPVLRQRQDAAGHARRGRPLVDAAAGRVHVDARSTSSSTRGTCRRSCWSPATCPGSFTFTRRNLRKLVTTVVVPYFVFETLLALFRTVVGHERLRGALHQPALADVVPHRAVPVAAGHPAAHPAAARAWRWPSRSRSAWSAGSNTVTALDLPRTFGLLPFFVAGLVMTREQFDWIARPRVRVVAAVLMATAFVVATRHGRQLQQGVALLAHRLPRPRRAVLARRLGPARPARGRRRPWRWPPSR